MLLMHFDGSNGGTTFTDSSPFNRTVSVDGNVNTSTTQKKFGTAAGFWDGTGDDLYGSYTNLALGAGDFTVDFWVYPTEARVQSMFETRIKGGAAIQSNSISLIMLSDRKVELDITGASTTAYASTATLTLNTWSHLAIVRSGTSINVYLNGTSIINTTSSLNFNVQGLTLGRFADDASGYYKGYLDELRMVSGVAAWTATFSPPTAAYLI